MAWLTVPGGHIPLPNHSHIVRNSAEAGPDTPTNIWLFFDSKETQPQPASSSGSG
jgi:hypothetical protein